MYKSSPYVQVENVRIDVIDVTEKGIKDGDYA